MMPYHVLFYTLVFLCGAAVGCFLNVYVYQIPFFSLFPLRGKSGRCGSGVRLRYLLVEGVNGILWTVTFLLLGISWDSLLSCLLLSALLALSIIDWKTFEIPLWINLSIALLGAVSTLLHLDRWPLHVLGFFCVSTLLWLVYLLTKGRGIGGGDIKLMAAAGLFLGWKLVLTAFLFGCLYASVIQILRMKLTKAGSTFAMGPYLSAGILTAIWFGESIVDWYTRAFP